MNELCPPYPEYMKSQIQSANRERAARIAQAEKVVLERNAAAKRNRLIKSLSWKKWVAQVDELFAESRRLSRQEFGDKPIRSASSKTPRLDAFRARLDAIEARARATQEPAIEQSIQPAPRRHWNLERLHAFNEDMMARIAARDRGQIAPLKRVYLIPVCGPDGQIIPGAAAGLRWNDRQNGWVGFRPEQV